MSSKDPIMRITYFILFLSLLIFLALFLTTNYWVADNPMYFNLGLLFIFIGLIALVVKNTGNLSLPSFKRMIGR